MIKSFRVEGKVQGVMFRQTFIRGLQKRNLKGGATNINEKNKPVFITIEAETENKINQVIEELLKIKILNSWNATVETISPIKNIQILQHEVTTENVDQHKWSSGVEFYF